MSSSALYIGTGRALLLTREDASREHRLAVIKAVLAIEEPFAIRFNDTHWHETRGVLLNADTAHQIRSQNTLQAVVTLVPERRRGKLLQQSLLKAADRLLLDDRDLDRHRNRFLQCMRSRFSCRQAFMGVVDFLDDLIGQTPPIRAMLDPRLNDVLQAIEDGLSEPLPARDLARLAFLSEDRFLHLFKEQLGLPLRAYVLYQRALLANREVLSGSSVTEAAHAAGFSDAAHYSRTHREMFGHPPSLLVKNRKRCKVYLCTGSSWL